MPKINKGTKKRGITPQGWWESPIAGIVHYQSGYEWRFMDWMDNHNIQWSKCKEKFEYISPHDQKIHTYTPDFIVEVDGEKYYIETKGALRVSDPAKFAAFPNDKKLVLLSYKELHDDLHIEGIKDYSKYEHNPNAWPYKILVQIPDWLDRGTLTEELQAKVSAREFLDKIL